MLSSTCPLLPKMDKPGCSKAELWEFVPLQSRHRGFGAAAMPCQARGAQQGHPKGTVTTISQPLCAESSSGHEQPQLGQHSHCWVKGGQDGFKCPSSTARMSLWPGWDRDPLCCPVQQCQPSGASHCH